MSSLTDFKISDEHKRKYKEDGFFILENIIPDKDLETVRNKCMDLIEQQHREMDSLGTDILNLSKRNSRYFVFLAFKDHPELGKFIFSDLMAEICKTTIGEEAYLFWEQFVVKGTDPQGAEFTWHQDSGYVDYQHKYYVNAWVPLDDVNEENGTIYLLPYGLAGTKEKIEHRPVPNSNDRVGYFGTEKGVPANCSVGSIVVFSSTTFHRSGANNTRNLRRAYAIQFSPEPIFEAVGSLKGLAEPFLKNGKRLR